MSLIIKGVDMPKSGESMTYSSKEIIEIPTPHGRLIDEEAIYNNVKSRCNNCHIRACAICGVTCILNDIRTAPTIIEAEV